MQIAAIPFRWSLFLGYAANRTPFYTEAEFINSEGDTSRESASSRLTLNEDSPATRTLVARHELEADIRPKILEEVRKTVISIIGTQISDSTPFMQAGLDSLGKRPSKLHSKLNICMLFRSKLLVAYQHTPAICQQVKHGQNFKSLHHHFCFRF